MTPFLPHSPQSTRHLRAASTGGARINGTGGMASASGVKTGSLSGLPRHLRRQLHPGGGGGGALSTASTPGISTTPLSPQAPPSPSLASSGGRRCYTPAGPAQLQVEISPLAREVSTESGGGGGSPAKSWVLTKLRRWLRRKGSSGSAGGKGCGSAETGTAAEVEPVMAAVDREDSNK